MPFKSKAQRRKFAQLLVEGKISDEAYERWNRETGRAELPERLGTKTKRAPKRTIRAKRRTKRRAKKHNETTRAPTKGERKTSRAR